MSCAWAHIACLTVPCFTYQHFQPTRGGACSCALAIFAAHGDAVECAAPHRMQARANFERQAGPDAPRAGFQSGPGAKRRGIESGGTASEREAKWRERQPTDFRSIHHHLGRQGVAVAPPTCLQPVCPPVGEHSLSDVPIPHFLSYAWPRFGVLRLLARPLSLPPIPHRRRPRRPCSVLRLLAGDAHHRRLRLRPHRQ